MNIILNKPTKAIVNVQVKRRATIPTHGWDESMFETNTPVVTKPVPRVPGKLELIYRIYDAQREFIGGVYPKRFNCRVISTVKNIERLFHQNPALMSFDDMTYNQAKDYFQHKALEVGIRNDFCIPFIFATEIKVKAHAFGNGYSHIFRTENGMRWMVLNTMHDFHYMSSNRQIVNNLSYHLNLEYQCNLHLAWDEKIRIEETTGRTVLSNRHLFTDACNYYMDPHLLDYETFMRAQVKELREVPSSYINELILSTDDLLCIDPHLAHEVEMAKCIYTGKINQWVGDYSKEPILG